MTWEEYKAMKNKDATATIEKNEVRTSKNSIDGMSWQEYKQKREEQRRIEEEQRKREEEQRKIEAQKQEQKRQEIINKQTSQKANNIVNDINKGQDLTELQKAYGNLSMTEQAELAKKLQEETKSQSRQLELMRQSQPVTPIYNKETIEKQTGTKLADAKYAQDYSNSIFQPSAAFKDGYQVGDITKTAVSTVGDATARLVGGIANIGEGMGKSYTYTKAKILDKIGQKEKAQALRENAKGTSSVKQDIDRFTRKIGAYSVLGGKSKNLAESLGYIAGIAAISSVGGEAAGALGGTETAATVGATVSSSAATFSSAMGQGITEAYNEGANDDDAYTYGIIAGTAETATELMFGGIGKGSKAIGLSKSGIGVDDALAKKVGSIFKNQLAKNFAEYSIKASGEGVEEVVSGIIQAVGKKVTYMSEAELSQLLQDQHLLEQFVDGAVISAISSAPGLVTTTMAGQDYIQDETPMINQIQELQKAQEALPTARRAQQLPKATEVAPRAGQAIENTEVAPAATQENTYSNKLKQLATEEINKSNISSQDKTEMLNVLKGLDTVTDADIEAIRNTIQGIRESQQLETKGDYKNDQTRRQKYMQYKNDTSTYDSTAVDEVLDTIPQNRNGRRTVKQWLQAADEIGKRIANLSNEEIEKIAYKSWFDIQPSKSITQYDNVAHKPVNFQKFTSDEWVNTINKAVNEARANNEVQENTNNTSLELPKNINYDDSINHVKDIFDKYSTFYTKNQDIDGGRDRINEFSVEHYSDYDDWKNNNVEYLKRQGLLTTDILNIDNNLVKLTTTREDNKLYINELYVEKQKQGVGSKVMKILKDYANKAGLQLDTDRELSTSKGFWDKTLNRANTTELPVINQENAVETTLPTAEEKKNIDTEAPKNLIESAKKYNFKYKDMDLSEIQTVLENKGISARFDDTEFKDSSVGAMWKLSKDENGNVKREIVLNPNANEKTVVQEMAIHELTHDIVAKNTNTSKNLYKEVKQWLEKDSDYQEQLSNLKEIYGEELAEEEAIAKTLQTKFGTQEEINNLVNYNPSMARKIYDWVVDKLNKITGGKIEKLYWEDVKNKFERAYSEEGNYNNSNTKYHISENFINEIEKSLKGKIPSNNQIKARDYTPKVLVDNGVKDLPMLLTQKHLRQIVYTQQEAENLGYIIGKKDHYHGLGKETLIKAIDNMDTPSEIYKQSDNNYLIITELKDNNNNQIIIPIQINGTGTYNDVRILENQISTVYGHEKLNKYLSDNNFEQIYKKNRSYINSEGVKSHDSINASTNSITSSKENVNTTDYNMQKSQNNAQNLPKDVKEIKNLNQFLREMTEKETDKYWKNQLMEAKQAGYADWIRRESPLHWKRGIVQQYLDYKNSNVTSTNLQDNQGRKLSKEQQEYFKNSKVRDEKGDLLTVYHGTQNGGFTQFKKYSYFTDSQDAARTYSGSIENINKNTFETGRRTTIGNYEGYINIETPFEIDLKGSSWDEIDIKDVNIPNIKEIIKNEGISTYENNGKTLIGTDDLISIVDYLNENGSNYDGIIIKNIYDNGKRANSNNTLSNDYIIFNNNQFKANDNTKPTSNPDIRYSISDTQEDRLSKLNEDFDLSAKLREELYDQRNDLQKKYDDLINSEEYKDAVKRAVKMDSSQVRETKEYELMKEAQNLKNQINDIQDEIDVATSEIRRLSEAIDTEEKQHRNPKESIKNAIKKLGLTDNFNEAGYMLEDGKLLDFSGRSQGSNAYNQRTMDHREINEFGYDMNEFIALGNIRMQPEGNGFELMKEPTAKQYNKLKEYIERANGEIYIDVYKNNKMGLYDSAEYKKGTPTNKIISDLQQYFKNGKFPAKSQYADFMYSKKQKGFDKYLEDRIGKKGTRTTLGELRSTYNSAPTADNVLATSEYTKKHALNPTEIANTNKESMNTTPQLETKNYKKGNKQSSFVSNILNDAQFLNKDLRQEMSKDENIRYYSGITNAETLEKAYNSLTEGGEKETLNWFSKNEKNITAEDVAKGWILLKQYQDTGDYQGAVEVAKKMREMGTSAGQAVQAYNIMARMSPEGMVYYTQAELSEAYSKMVEGKSKQWIEKNQDKFTLTPEETQTIMDIMQEVSKMEDGREKNVKLAQIQKLVSSKIPPTAGQSVKAWMRISMLFNLKTQVRNVMGNTVVLPVNTTADIFSSAMDKLISKKTGVRTTGITKEGIKGYGRGFRKGLFESYDDFRKGINTRNVEGNRFEISEGKSFKDKGIGKALNRIDNILSFSLDAGDRGFYEASFTNSINNQLVLNKTNQVTQEMIDIATNEALQRTWQDNNAYTQSVLRIRNILNNVNVKGYGLGDVLIPFAKTPANLTKAIVDYSPVGLTKTLTLDAKKFTNSLNNGQYSAQLQHQFVQNLGKGMAGSLLYVLAYGLAKAGIATGEADDDKDVKNFMKNSLGIGSYSIKIGNKSFSYDWAQPVATSLAIMTNYVKYSKDNPDANAINKAIKSLDIGSEQLLKQSFMESINTVLNGSGTTMENLSQAILDLPARAIPTFSKQIADMVDGTQRTSFEYDNKLKSASNAVLAKIPFASKTLPAARDTLGNEIQKYGGNNNFFNVMINPANTNKGQLSKAGEEIYNVYMQTGDTTIFPRTAPYYINYKGEKITMTAEERNKFQTVTGKYVEDSLNSLINDKDYKKLSNEEKSKIINEIVSDSYTKAKYDVLKIDSNGYEKLRNTLQEIKPSSYYNYKFKTSGMTKDNEKIQVIVDSSYSNEEKLALYENYVNSNDKNISLVKDLDINTDEYLKYKLNAGTKKAEKVSYIENTMRNVSYMNKLMLLGTEYALSSSEKDMVYNYVIGLDKTKKQKLEILSKINGFTVSDNGTVRY